MEFSVVIVCKSLLLFLNTIKYNPLEKFKKTKSSQGTNEFDSFVSIASRLIGTNCLRTTSRRRCKVPKVYLIFYLRSIIYIYIKDIEYYIPVDRIR